MKLAVVLVILVTLLAIGPALSEIVRPDANGYIGKWSEITSAKIFWTGQLSSGYLEWQQLQTGEIIHTRVDIFWGLGVFWDNQYPDVAMGWWGTSVVEDPITHGEYDISIFSQYLKLGWAQWYENGWILYQDPPSPTISWVRINEEYDYLHFFTQTLSDRWLDIEGTREPVPEPASFLVLFGGLFTLRILKRR